MNNLKDPVRAGKIKKPSMQEKEGTTVHTGYMGTVQYKLEEFLYEEYNRSPLDITGVFHGKKIDVNSNEEVECSIKVRMQLNSCGRDRRDSYAYERGFDNERQTLKACEGSGRTPKFLASVHEVQDHTGFFPGGYLHVLATSRLPGQPVSRLIGDLTPSDLQAMKEDLFEIIKHIRGAGYTLDNIINRVNNIERPLDIDDNHVWYDRASQTVYFFDLSRAQRLPFRYYYAGSSSSNLSARTEEAVTRSDFWMRLVASLPRNVAASQRNVFNLCFRDKAGQRQRQGSDDCQMVQAAN